MGNGPFQSSWQKWLAVDVHRGLLDYSGYESGMLILDLIMPDVNSGKVFDVLHEIESTMPIMLSSRYALNSQENKIIRKGCSADIQNTFTHPKLSHKFLYILDGEAASGDGIYD